MGSGNCSLAQHSRISRSTDMPVSVPHIHRYLCILCTDYQCNRVDNCKRMCRVNLCILHSFRKDSPSIHQCRCIRSLVRHDNLPDTNTENCLRCSGTAHLVRRAIAHIRPYRGNQCHVHHHRNRPDNRTDSFPQDLCTMRRHRKNSVASIH